MRARLWLVLAIMSYIEFKLSLIDAMGRDATPVDKLNLQLSLISQNKSYIVIKDIYAVVNRRLALQCVDAATSGKSSDARSPQPIFELRNYFALLVWSRDPRCEKLGDSLGITPVKFPTW